MRAALPIAVLLISCTLSCTRTRGPRDAPPPAIASGSVARRVITVSGTTEADVQRAFDGAGSGVTIVVPAGRYAIHGTLTLHGDDVQLLGAGLEATVLWRTHDEGEHIRAILHAADTKRLRVSGIRFDGVSLPDSTGKDVGVLLEDAEDFRVDHAYFGHMGFAGVRTNGTSRGVVDHSTFFAELKPAIGTEGYGVVVYGTNALSGFPLGSREATFVEDCEFSLCRHAVAANKGGRYVFRHNHVANGVIAHAADAHGTEYASEVGTEWVDIHDNVIEQANHEPPYYDGWAVRIRGGQGLVWNNTIRGYRTAVELTQLTSEATGPVFVWNNTLEPAGTMVHADRAGQFGNPVFTEAAPPRYTPYPYPHPLAANR